MKKLTGLTLVETRLAAVMLTPALLIVFAIILFPVLTNFWISFKPVKLANLRAPTAIVREQVASRPNAAGDEFIVRYRVRNSSRNIAIERVQITTTVPAGVKAVTLPEGFRLESGRIVGSFGRWDGGFIHTYTLRLRAVTGAGVEAATRQGFFHPTTSSSAPNVLTNLSFTLKNYALSLSERQFVPAFLTTVAYTFFGTIGAILLGLFAAQILNRKFFGRGFLRGIFLFPYVAPVIAVAFTWAFFLDPFSGTLNALLTGSGITRAPISFLSERSINLHFFGLAIRLPLALSTVIAFESWRYFPFAFLFILARLQAIDEQLYESAQLDGASPFQRFFHITIPQLASVLSTLFLLRFMWTFNKFDDVFLLTGGAAGTETLPIAVYDNAFGRADIGAGAATAVILFAFLAIFLLVYFRFVPEEEQ